MDSLTSSGAAARWKIRPQDAAGFTLIEMLVVVLIMGLLIGLVSVVARADPRGLLRIEAERLAQLIDLAASEANITGKPIGWSANDSTYRFLRSLNGAAWTEIRDNDLLRERTLPDGMTVSGLRVENMRRQDALRLEFSPYAPPLFFTIELTLGAEHYIVRSAAGGSARALAGGSDNAPAL